MVSMHSADEWHQHAGTNMGYAQETQRKATRQNEMSLKAHDDTVNDNITMYNEVHGTLKQKIQTSYRLIDMLQRRADSLENSIQHTQHSLVQLDAAHRAKDTQIQLCHWRLEQREARPLREQVNDGPETQLETERETLMETQRKLSESMKRTKAMLVELENKLKEVRHDLDHKTQALGVDEACLRTTQRSFQTVVERVRPQSVPAGGSTRITSAAGSSIARGGARSPNALGESSRNEMQRQQEAARLNISAASREEAAKALRDENKQQIARCQKAAEQAAAATERSFQERISENQQMRRRLEGEIGQTNNKIDHTKHTIAETRAQIKALDEPIDCTTTCSSYRMQRATREHIVDPVTARIQEHQMTVLRAREELVAHHEQEKINLKDLQERKERLKDDHKDKTSALHIDLNCLTHQAAHMNGKSTAYLSKTRLSRAIGVDPRFVPMPGLPGPVLPHTAR